jgi:hypothetical protein
MRGDIYDNQNDTKRWSDLTINKSLEHKYDKAVVRENTKHSCIKSFLEHTPEIITK